METTRRHADGSLPPPPDAGFTPPRMDAGSPPTDAGPPPAADAGTDTGPPLVLDAGTEPCREGALMTCMTACATIGLRTCAGGTFGACAPPDETCDDVDENCNGSVDEGLTRGCTSACGAGTESCSRGAWAGCTAPAPRTEECNRIDDDCDGRVDDGQQAVAFDPVPMSELTAAHPACVGVGSTLDVCLTSAKRWCNARASCFVGGAGLLQAIPTTARVVCFGPDTTEVRATFAEVSAAAAISVTVANIGNRVAEAAVNRFCRSRGYGAGVGPVEHSDTEMWVDCLPASVGVSTDVATPTLNGLGCDPLGAPDGIECAAAADNHCRGLGFVAGYGPVEWNETMSAVVCIANP